MAFPARTCSSSCPGDPDPPTAFAAGASSARRPWPWPRGALRLQLSFAPSSAGTFRPAKAGRYALLFGARAAQDIHHGVVPLMARVLEELLAVVECERHRERPG